MTSSAKNCDKMDEAEDQIRWAGRDKPRRATDKLVVRAFKPRALALFWHLILMGAAECEGSQKLKRICLEGVQIVSSRSDGGE